MYWIYTFIGSQRLPWWRRCKESACNAGDLGQSQGPENPLKKGMATHSTIPAWKIPWTEEDRQILYQLHHMGRPCWCLCMYLWSCMDVRVGLWRGLSTEELMPLNCGVGEDSWESLGLQGDPTSPFWRRSTLGFLWKEWCWSWNSSSLATSCEELTHWKRLWCWEGLAAGGEGDDGGWDGWMASLTRWTWVWVNSGSWWWTGRPGMLRFMGSQRVGHDWAADLIWSDLFGFWWG